MRKWASAGVVGPVGRRRVVAAAAVGTFVELYDIWIFGYFAIFLAGQFFPKQNETAALLATFAIFAVGFVVRPIGGVVFGHVGDRIGRRAALASALLLMTFATVAFGLLPTYADVGMLAPVLLVTCRILQGLSASAEIPGAQILVLEHTPVERRGRAVALNNAMGNLGTAVAATVALVLAKTLSPDQLAGWGWRVAFLAAAPIGLVGWYVRARVMESPEFGALGDRARRGTPLPQALRTSSRGMLVVTLWMAAVLLGGYLLGGFLPGYLVKIVGLSPDAAFTATVSTVVVSLLSILVGGYLIDRFPLRRVAIGAMTGLALTAVPTFLVITSYQTLTAAVLAQGVCAVFIGLTYTTGAMLSVTLFPAAIRFTATAVAVNLGVTTFASTGPYVATWLVATTGSASAPGIYLFAVAAAGLAAAVVGLPRRLAAASRSEPTAPRAAAPAPEPTWVSGKQA